MSTGAKIALALVGLFVIFLIYDAYKKRKEAEELAAAKAKNPTCKEISPVEWTAKKRKLHDDIFDAQLTIYTSNAANNLDFYNAYRIPAMEEGYSGGSGFAGIGVLEYGAWVEAHKKMLEQGYCEQLN